MLLVVAHERDLAARTLVDRWRGAGEEAGLLVPADLSRRGWLHVPGDASRGRAVIDGEVIETTRIRGVVTRLVAVTAVELPGVHPDDRAYAAAESHAFLMAWLSALACPVLNPPLPGNLTGVASGSEQWGARAQALGIPARPSSRRAVHGEPKRPAESPTGRPIEIDVVAGRAFVRGVVEASSDEEAFRVAGLKLARAAGVELMRCLFDRGEDGAPRFVDAGPWVDLTSMDVADAITERLVGFVHSRPGNVVARAGASA